MEREIRSIDASAFRLADFHGKVVVINLWASWCGPCRREIPEYEKVRKGYAGRDVEFVGLTLEDPNSSSDKVHKFLREVSFGFRLGWADPDLARTLRNGKNAVPQTIVIDGTGKVVKRWSGYAPGQSGDHLKEAIDVALDRHEWTRMIHGMRPVPPRGMWYTTLTRPLLNFSKTRILLPAIRCQLFDLCFVL